MGLFSGIGKALKSVAKVAAPAIGTYFGGPIGGSLGSSIAGAIGAEDANAFSAAQSADQMEFQERMSSTAHQREVKDLLAAGLNPIMSGMGGSGASTPVGSQAQHIENTASSASQNALNTAQLKLIDSQSKAAESQATLNSANAAKSAVEARATAATAGLSEFELERNQKFKDLIFDAYSKGLDAQSSKSIFDQLKASNDWNTIHYLNELARKHGYGNFETAIRDQDFLRGQQDLILERLKTNEAKAYSDMYSTDYGKNVAPYVNSASSIVGAGSGLIGAGSSALRAGSYIKYLRK